MIGPLICYATKCTNGSAEEFWLALLLAVAAVAGLVLLLKWLIPDDKDKN